MKTVKVRFAGSLGGQLAGAMDLPDDEEVSAFALFAHCFTCSKDLRASANVTRALAKQGYGVLRFDFTGLGHSEGDFAESNFASNLDDLVLASELLAAEYEAPRLLIGHSLGGAAVVHAAQRIPSSKAVATIGAPFDPEHVTHLLADNVDTIQEEGEAVVTIGGRPFTIRKEFLETLQRDNLADTVRMMRKALLILHSPIDATVGVENAQRLFEAAVHPKSFVSLDKADHLLQKKADAEYAGRVIATWANKYV
jgi:putative redox protein